MGKESADFGLGAELRQHRKALRLTQAAVAKAASVAERTVRDLEQGGGTLASFLAVLAALELTIAGRNLPGGSTPGERLATLRRRRGYSQASLARTLNVSRPTIRALERESTGRLATLQEAFSVLGAGAYLALANGKAAFYNHAGNASVHHGWETPPELLEALYRVFGRFDLDPCAPRRTRTAVKAAAHFTVEDDGLHLPWRGIVFLNPPYGRTLSAWIAKAHEEVRSGRAKTVVALLPARPDTRYWHEHVAGKAVVYFLRGRLRFGGIEQAAPFPSALVVWGSNPEMLAGLDAALPDAWRAG